MKDIKKRLRVGQSVRLHPATDLFMRGVVYARIAGIGNNLITIEWTPPVRDWRKMGPGAVPKPIPFRVTFDFAREFFMDDKGELIFPEKENL